MSIEIIEKLVTSWNGEGGIFFRETMSSMGRRRRHSFPSDSKGQELRSRWTCLLSAKCHMIESIGMGHEGSREQFALGRAVSWGWIWLSVHREGVPWIDYG
jgi:hypothetical protein